MRWGTRLGDSSDRPVLSNLAALRNTSAATHPLFMLDEAVRDGPGAPPGPSGRTVALRAWFELGAGPLLALARRPGGSGRLNLQPVQRRCLHDHCLGVSGQGSQKLAWLKACLGAPWRQAALSRSLPELLWP